MINGILNVYKEKGYTSHDVVARLRGIVKQKKIGHTGTLDPEAEGVLPVCLGKGTKLCELLTDKRKTYRTVMLLGTVTDTQDTTGTILEEKEVTVTESQVREAVLSFLGDYDQVPPMYSALKVDGKKLYEYAREGKVIERAARKVVIYDIEIEWIQLPKVSMKVTCSKGTYIRTLCHDIGETLGCGACMNSLLRTQVSCFSLEESHRLADIERMQEEGTLKQVLMPMDAVFEEYPKVKVNADGEKFLRNGNPLNLNSLQFVQESENGNKIRVYGVDGEFCAVYEYRAARKQYFPVKMFL